MARTGLNRRFTAGALVACVGLGLGLGTSADAQDLSLDQIAFTSGSGNGPIYATFAPGDDDHLYVVEQGGRIRVLDLTTNTWEASNFLNVPVSTSGNEMGLLGLAFAPDYETSGNFYVYASGSSFAGGQNHASYIYEYQRNGAAGSLTANAASQSTVLRFGQPDSNHNGGWMGFGQDGYLYIAVGDGGAANDSGSGHTNGSGNAQDITNNLLGSMLRIDPSGDDFAADANRNYAIPDDNPFVGITGDDEIWAYGLRNPWRPSFDRETGDLYIADVGQNSREEINFQNADSTGGENYGWRLREGTIATPTGGVGGPAPAGAIDPIHEYFRNAAGGFSITGGYVYRGPITQAQGEYYFADFATSNIWTLEVDRDTGQLVPNSVTNVRTDLADGTFGVNNVSSISSFAEDAAGNLYIISIGGNIYRVTTDRVLGDMNGSFDPNRPDYAVNMGDVALFGEAINLDQAAFELANPGADYAAGDTNQDGQVNADDALLMLEFLRLNNVSNSTISRFFDAVNPGDLTEDGLVGVEDLDLLLANWGDTVAAGNHSRGDANNDGVIDQLDLDIIEANWGNTLPGFPGAVPEPTALAAFGIAGLLLGRRRR
ncbi:MAG: PQQ-dependent sugar dehydrogenase [Phycisphaerales bacterium JB063]